MHVQGPARARRYVSFDALLPAAWRALAAGEAAALGGRGQLPDVSNTPRLNKRASSRPYVHNATLLEERTDSQHPAEPPALSVGFLLIARMITPNPEAPHKRPWYGRSSVGVPTGFSNMALSPVTAAMRRPERIFTSLDHGFVGSRHWRSTNRTVAFEQLWLATQTGHHLRGYLQFGCPGNSVYHAKNMTYTASVGSATRVKGTCATRHVLIGGLCVSALMEAQSKWDRSNPINWNTKSISSLLSSYGSDVHPADDAAMVATTVVSPVLATHAATRAPWHGQDCAAKPGSRGAGITPCFPPSQARHASLLSLER
eukprot:357634-Chlamydomonas_euryale.AAC.6